MHITAARLRPHLRGVHQALCTCQQALGIRHAKELGEAGAAVAQRGG